MQKVSSLSIVIPTYNDEHTIEDVVKAADMVGKEVSQTHEIVILNDGSTNNVGKVIHSLVKKIKSLRVLHHESNMGYGRTIKDLYYASKNDWIFSCPGDYQIHPGEVKKLIKEGNGSDIVLGRRSKRNDHLLRKIQSRVYNLLIRSLFNISIEDINSVRLMRRNILQEIALQSNSAFVDAELIILAKKAGHTVIEVPIEHKARSSSGATGGKFFATILPTIVDLLRFSLVH